MHKGTVSFDKLLHGSKRRVHSSLELKEAPCDSRVEASARIVAGDQWSSISVPLAEYAPWTAPIMFFMMTTISLGVMNLILAVRLGWVR